MDQGSTKVTIFWPLQLREEGDRRVYKKEKTHKQLERKITNLTKKIKKLRKAGKTVSSGMPIENYHEREWSFR